MRLGYHGEGGYFLIKSCNFSAVSVVVGVCGCECGRGGGV